MHADDTLGAVIGPEPAPTGATGPLSGLHLGVKDLIDVRDLPTGAGGRNPLVVRAAADAPCVAALRRAGARVVCKTATVELASGGWGANAAVGTPWNPWDPARHRAPGGSSSGSAVAVAAGLVDAAIGTDTGGSVRIPASFCGVVGFKPTTARVSRDGIAPLSPTLDTPGLLARDVETVARLYAVWSGTADAARELDGAGAPPRFAALVLDGAEGLDQDVRAAWTAARAGLSAAAGAALRPLDQLAALEALTQPTGDIFAYEGYRHHADWIARHRDEMDPWVVRRLMRGRDIAPADYRAALEGRSASQAAYVAALDAAGADILLLPTTPVTARPLEEIDEALPIPARFTRAFNYLDVPAISLPCGWDRDGMPVGLQLAGRPDADWAVLRAAAFVERALDLPPRRPPLWRGPLVQG